jgi:hypothetical protein
MPRLLLGYCHILTSESTRKPCGAAEVLQKSGQFPDEPVRIFVFVYYESMKRKPKKKPKNRT